jgi:uroporphyrinogen-III synthase
MRLIVTRPAAQALPWVAALRTLGCDAHALPLIDIAPLADMAPLQAAWQRLQQLPSVALVMFVSANAVQHFVAAQAPGAAWPAGVRAGSVGPGTTMALRQAGVPADLIDEPAADARSFDSEALWARLSGREWQGRRALIVRGEEGRDWLADTLRSRGATVAFVAAYRRCAPVPDAAGRALLAEALAAPARHLWIFSSSEAVGHLRALVPGADWAASMALASHPRIASAARAAGFGQVAQVQPKPEAVAAWLHQGPRLQSVPL